MAGTTWNRTQARRGRGGVRLAPAAVDSLIALAALLGMALLWRATARPVDLTVDGVGDTVFTHRATLGALLDDLGLDPGAQDTLSHPPQTRLRDAGSVTLLRGRPVRILADGRDEQTSSAAATAAEVFTLAGIEVDAYDVILLDGEPVAHDAPLPAPEQTLAPLTYDRGHAWDRLEVEPLQLRLRRALPVIVDEGGLPYTVRTTAQTVGEALREAEITLYLGDRVEPSLGSAVTTGLRVLIQRSTPLSIYVDGRQHKTRTRAGTVGDALTAMGVVLAGLDRVEPALETELYPGINIAVTRVSEDIEVEEQIEPFETIFFADPNLPIDTQQVVNAGAEGITRQRYRVIYENGAEVSRVMEDEWLAQAPDQRRIAYGQQITAQTAVVDGVPITYWRKIRMLATSYTAESAGGNRTRTGDLLRDNLVAVDPRLIPLRSQVFVPGYGQADALDTGGGIISRRIDLAYVNRPWQSWSRWVDVYLLWPPPPAGDITWVVPNFPRVPGS